MIQISKTEAEEIRKRFPKAHITITNRQSSHKHYYVEELSCVKRFLAEEQKGAVTHA